MKKNTKKVLVLRTCDENLKSRHGSFQWAAVGGETIAPDWNNSPECGNGLHGWLWGCGDWSLKDGSKNPKWLILEVDADEIINLAGKVKFPKAKTLLVVDKWADAISFIQGHPLFELKLESSASGDSGHASASGSYGHASASGYSGHASASGSCGHASASGYSGHASASGSRGHASASGSYGHASAGFNGQSKAAIGGVISILYFDSNNRARLAVGYPGEDGIEADTWYQVVDGKLTKVNP